MYSIALLLIAAAFGTRIVAVPRHPIIQEGDDVIVNIDNGALRGVVATSLNGVLYNKFLGIPYATPPLGDLRFRAPQPAASWSEVRDALSFADACAQPLFFGLIPITTGSEDCLYLNVYAPAAASGPYPVMVYIHGGAFKGGSSSSSTPHSFVEKGVVLVTIAYRLGALGFLSLLNDDIPGNAGFKDQVLALQWVQRNIAAFGGDPSSVVIFGESAGGGSTSHLFLSPATKGLFSGVSMESGVATTSWALTDKPRERAYRMAEALGFQAQGDNHTDDDDARLAAFLRTANYSDLTDDDSIALTDFEKRCPLPLAFLPVVEPPSDSAVIVEPPVDVLKAGSYNQVPIMLGVTSGEGAVVLMLSSLLTQAGIADMKENFTALVGSQLPLPTEEQRTRAAEQLEQFYFGDEGFSMGQMQAVIDLFSDLYFIHPADSFARAVANSSNLPIHFYYFGYNGTGSTDYGMVHAGELLYLFPSNSSGPITNPKSNDGKVASELATLWTNFPKYGDPAPSGSPVVWEKLTENASNYLDMELEFVTRQDLLKERMDFWRDILSS
ncbi:juvenile hormone esterase-like isoform X1 [Schistocerca nitens]|uniref:juvenile hormone esterase-like isoform X1 n=1 Tax=Schistocerca nitens TaxID=7011 RepID=UPI00211868B3|nr:juvenile hormone esterase-like isoform X1 [Schistocerca nitens]